MAERSITQRIRNKLWWIVYRVRNLYHHTGERVNPDFPDGNFENHFKVYKLASQFVRDKDVLDCGSGTGYGSAYLAQQGARTVTGIDFSSEAVRFARRRYREKGLRFLKMDAQKLSFADASFDFVFSSENLEHLGDPHANVSEIRRVLRPGGIALIATPNKEIFSPGLEESSNPYHIKEFYFQDLRDLLKEFFSEVYIFENSLETPSEVGRRLKQERVARGEVGLNPQPVPTATLGNRVVDLTQLHNTHSFLALMW